MKVVINRYHGGFKLSHAGIMRYAKHKGVQITAITRVGRVDSTSMFAVPPEGARLDEWSTRYVIGKSDKELGFLFSIHDVPSENMFSERDIPRNDPHLVAAVEELGAAAGGDCSSLTVIEIPDDVEWLIQEYDGMEWVAEKHRTWRG